MHHIVMINAYRQCVSIVGSESLVWTTDMSKHGYLLARPFHQTVCTVGAQSRNQCPC